MSYEPTTGNIAENMDAHERELQDVFRERLRQLRKFGPQNRAPFEWFLILSEEVGEVAKECVEMQFDDAKHPYADPERYYKELTEVVAVGLAAMQNFNQRRPKCFHNPEDGGCSLCARQVAPSAPTPVPSKAQLAAALSIRYGLPRRDYVYEAEDIRDLMPMTEGSLHFQAHVAGYTDWYAMMVNASGEFVPASIEKLPF